MTCEEIHARFSPESPGGASASVPGDVAEHIADCPSCSQSLDGYHQLHARVALVRDSVPAIAPTLDGVVIANYRQYIRSRSAKSSCKLTAAAALAALAWPAAVAFAAIVCYGAILFFSRGQEIGMWDAHRHASQLPVNARTPRNTASTPAAEKLGIANGSKQTKQISQKPNPQSRHVQMATGISPAEFHSLLYCDELSCGGAMDVVRVQIPAEALGLPAKSAGTLVSADVLVGSDGIARGIRIAE